ncbi:MAG: ABC transporter substrate-binding protein, partial [Actinomycetota bacterium]|nr:ABC transporter substrate-binding protein [Actinomycetota bacterium]
EPPRNAEPGEESPVSQIRQGGTARVLLPEEPACMNPYLPECGEAEALVGTVLEAPLAVGPSLGYRPLLAEQIPAYEAGTLSLEPLTVEVRLRAGIVFSNGEPLTSADVKWTYERAARLAEGGGIAPLYAGFGRLSRVETPDERTARLIFDEPYAFWRDLLAAPVLPRHVYEERDFGGLALNREPVGSGPFLLEDRTEEIDLVKNREYWAGEPLPDLEGMEISSPPPGAAAGSLSEGRSDFGFFVTTRALPDSGDLLRAAAAPVRVENLLFNARRLDGTARAAVARTIDRERVAGEAGAPVARSFVPPEFVPGYAPAWEDYGPSGSRGTATPGEALDLVYSQESRNPVRDAVVGDLVSDLSGSGIGVEARPVSSGELFGEVLPEGDFDLALFTGGPPAGYEVLLSSLPPEPRESLARTLGMLDTEERAQALARAQEQMAAQDAVLPLFVWPDTMAWSSTLAGPRPETPYRGLMSNAREWAFYK